MRTKTIKEKVIHPPPYTHTYTHTQKVWKIHDICLKIEILTIAKTHWEISEENFL